MITSHPTHYFIRRYKDPEAEQLNHMLEKLYLDPHSTEAPDDAASRICNYIQAITQSHPRVLIERSDHEASLFMDLLRLSQDRKRAKTLSP